ncbi:MAG: ABC transporter permease [Anaerolineae bacterium]|nr:ABC transporter permease [Anaerolineae bacterium]
MQSGVENMHMSSSILPSDAIERVRSVRGVQDAVGVLYANVGIEIDGTIIFSYIFGVAPNAPLGGPWSLVEGSPNPAANEIVIDRIIAERYGMSIGDSLQVMGYDLRIAGLTEGTFGMATSITFANKTAMALLMGVSPESASYILIQPEQDADLETLIADIQTAIPDANLLTKADFIASDQEMIRQMGADIVQMMNTISYVIGMLVIGITIYTATLERTQEYGVLKAIGAKPSQLLRLVLSQSLVSAALGYIVGVLAAYGLAIIVVRFVPEMPILLQPTRWILQAPILGFVAIVAALLPMAHIVQIDPLVAFKA